MVVVVVVVVVVAVVLVLAVIVVVSCHHDVGIGIVILVTIVHGFLAFPAMCPHGSCPCCTVQLCMKLYEKKDDEEKGKVSLVKL